MPTPIPLPEEQPRQPAGPDDNFEPTARAGKGWQAISKIKDRVQATPPCSNCKRRSRRHSGEYQCIASRTGTPRLQCISCILSHLACDLRHLPSRELIGYTALAQEPTVPAHRDDSTAMAPARRSLRTRPSASDGADRQIEIIDLEPALPDDFWARYKSYNFKSRTPYTNPLGLHDCAASKCTQYIPFIVGDEEEYFELCHVVLKDHARLLQEWALNRGGGDRWGGQKPIRYSRWNASTFRILTRWLHGKDSDALFPSQTSGKEYIEAYEFAWSYKTRGLQDYVLAELSRRLLPEGYTESISYINTIWGAELKGSALERFLIDGIILEAERPWLGEVGNEDGDLDPTLTTSDEAVQPLPLNPYLFYALMRQYRTIGVIEQAAKHTFKMIDEQACRYHSHGANEKCPYGAAAPAPAENPQTPVSTATTPDQVTITAPAANSYTSMDGLRLRDLSNEAISAQLQRIDEESNRLNQERTRMYAEMYRRLAPAAEPRTMVQKRKAHAQAQGRSVQLMVEISLPQETGQLRAAEEDQ